MQHLITIYILGVIWNWMVFIYGYHKHVHIHLEKVLGSNIILSLYYLSRYIADLTIKQKFWCIILSLTSFFSLLFPLVYMVIMQKKIHKKKADQVFCNFHKEHGFILGSFVGFFNLNYDLYMNIYLEVEDNEN